jgi:hypothetical protein
MSEMRVSQRLTSRVLAPAVVLLLCGSLALAAECSGDQKKKLERFFEGRRVTAKIDLPLVHTPGGLWVFWNGEYDLESYAESLKHGPASILRGQTSTIKDVRVRGKEILYGVGGGGLMKHWKGPYDQSPEQARKHGSLVSVTFGRKLTAADCSVESNVRALSGVLEIAGMEAPAPLPSTPAAAGTSGSASVSAPAPPEESGFELISAAVEPARVRPGESVRLVTHFRVNGSTLVEVSESRQLYLQGQGLFSQPRVAAASWTAGVHQSVLAFQVPAGAPTGVYRYAVSVRALGRQHDKEALFEIY